MTRSKREAAAHSHTAAKPVNEAEPFRGFPPVKQIGWARIVCGDHGEYIEMIGGAGWVPGPGANVLPVWEERHGHHHQHAIRFKDLEVGEHFTMTNQWGIVEYVKLPHVRSGQQIPGAPAGVGTGFVNCIEVGSCQVSGMGPDVEAFRMRDQVTEAA